MYYDELLETAVTDESTVELDLYNKYNYDRTDKDNQYSKYKMRVPCNGSERWVTVENYGSGLHGNVAKNATTGSTYNIKVGSKEEDSLFKVTDSTGRNGRKEPYTYFYDSPEEFEKNNHMKVSQEVKSAFYNRVRN